MAPFAALILDRDPYLFGDLPGLAQAYLQDAGGFLFVGLFFYLLISLTRPQAVPRDGGKKGISPVPLACWAIATLLYCGYGSLILTGLGKGPQAPGLDLLNVKPLPDPNGYVKVVTPKFSLAGYSFNDLPTYVKPFVRPPEPAAGEKEVAAKASEWSARHYPWQALLLSLGGLVSLVGAVSPVLGNLAKLRFRRIWALAVLCIKEGMRNKLFLAFLIILVPLMFPVNWFLPPKAEDELRDAVNWVMPLVAAPLVLIAKLLAGYALPNEVKNQNIYTIVTKPVERFEILLGRFLGYAVLLTGVVAVVGLFTLFTILASNPSEESKKESGVARVPVRGSLSFQSRKADFAGTDVGREFNYRKHIGGSPRSSQRAVYAFNHIPSGLASADRPIPVEFNFDIYRLTKGNENEGVFVNIRVISWQRDQAPPSDSVESGEWRWGSLKAEGRGGPSVFTPDTAEARYKADAVTELRKVPEYNKMWEGMPYDTVQSEAEQLLARATPQSPAWAAADALARKYGYFEYRRKEVFDFHPERVALPPGLFANAAQGEADGRKAEAGKPRLLVYVHCETPSQMLGMAEGDLFILQAEESFAWNHLKSMVGLWCWLLIVVGLGVALSTYLDFVVTLLSGMFLFVVAFGAAYINELGQTIGKGGSQGGPMRALTQILQAKQSTALPESTAWEETADIFDVVYAWGFRRLLNVLPDVDSFYWTRYVAEGFSIPLEALVMNVVVMLAYLFPWFLMGYYLIRGREVAA